MTEQLSSPPNSQSQTSGKSQDGTSVDQQPAASAGPLRRRSSRHHMRRWVRRLLVPKVRPSPSQDATAREAERTARMRILIRREEQSLLTPSKTALRRMLRESGKRGQRPEPREMSSVWKEIYGNN